MAVSFSPKLDLYFYVALLLVLSTHFLMDLDRNSSSRATLSWSYIFPNSTMQYEYKMRMVATVNAQGRHMKKNKRVAPDHTQRRIGKSSKVVIEAFHNDWVYIPGNLPIDASEESFNNSLINLRESGYKNDSSYHSLFSPSGPIFFSAGFFSVNSSYICPPKPCESLFLAQGIAHFMIGTGHSASFPMLVHRVCEITRKCMMGSNVHIIVQRPWIPPSQKLAVPSDKRKFNEITQFLTTVRVRHHHITSNFTANNKMMSYLKLMNSLTNNSKQVIYHSDLDEIPRSEGLLTALEELKSGQCDAIVGAWRDRVAMNGDMPRIMLSQGGSIEEQFPHSCRISELFNPLWTCMKVIAYRGNIRLTSGQHEMWGDVDFRHPNVNFTSQIVYLNSTEIRSPQNSNSYTGSSSRNRRSLQAHGTPFSPDKSTPKGNINVSVAAGKNVLTASQRRVKGHHRLNMQESDRKKDLALKLTSTSDSSEIRYWNFSRSVKRQLSERSDKSTPKEEIIELLPVLTYKPRICKTRVFIDHYKFVAGLMVYLQKRVEYYKTKHLGWWKASEKLLKSIEKDQRICIKCPKNNCYRITQSVPTTVAIKLFCKGCS